MANARVFRAWRLMILLAGFASLPGHVHAERLVDPAQLEAWADAYYGQAIAEKRSPGITISVVQDGEVVLAKGYGYADYGKGTPVDPEASGFIVGSITKTFIATAIGQLVDRGAIKSFDDPANMYLKRVQLPGERGARVTIRHLLSHRAGFEDVEFGYLDRSGWHAQIPLSSAEILRFMPQLVMEPGGPSVYSNWSFSLLGFLIEDVTGERIDTYLEKHIWAPLGMTHTSMIYGHMPENLSVNYAFEKDGTPVAMPSNDHPPHPWISPAGTVVSTASDMARYMNAHLLEGNDGGYPLVSQETFRQLHTEKFRNSPISVGFGAAFWTTELNGASTIEHGGGAPGFQSMMVMIPGKRFGYFISAMQGGLVPWAHYSEAEIAAGKLAVREPPTGFELRESFVDRFLERTSRLPVTGSPTPAAAVPAKSDLAKLTGVYWTLLRPFTNLAVLGQAFIPTAVLRVELADQGQGLMINGSGPYTEVRRGVFVSPTGKNNWTDPYTIDRLTPPYIAFRLDDTGRNNGLVVGLGDQLWAPVSPLFNARTMLFGFVAFGLVAMAGAFFFLWPQRRRLADPTNYLGLCITLAVVAFPCAIMVGFARGDSLVNQMALGEKARLWVMVIAANATVLLAVLLGLRAVKEWRHPGDPRTPGWARWGRRIHVGAVALSCCGLLVVFAFFNLLGVHMPG